MQHAANAAEKFIYWVSVSDFKGIGLGRVVLVLNGQVSVSDDEVSDFKGLCFGRDGLGFKWSSLGLGF